MVTSEYITSGILEQYVMGTATPQERQEVECMSKIYPELREELTRIEASLEAYITAHSVTPPAHLKAKIFDAIDNLAKETPEIEAETPEKGKVIVMQSSRRWQYLAAASVAGLALATSLFWSNYQSQKATLAAFSARTQTAETALQNSRSELAVLNNADFSPVKLSGIPQKAPAASMQVLWNKNPTSQVTRWPCPMHRCPVRLPPIIGRMVYLAASQRRRKHSTMHASRTIARWLISTSAAVMATLRALTHYARPGVVLSSTSLTISKSSVQRITHMMTSP